MRRNLTLPPFSIVLYSQALGYLLSFADFERSGRFLSRADVAPTRALFDLLGSPDEGRTTVHIAGSKGKGSTAAILAAVLRAAGYETGLYTSPHLHSFRERVQLDGEPVTAEEFAFCTAMLPAAEEEVKRLLPQREVVTFDLLTALGFLAFKRARTRVQVIETGLGGRLDSTNAMRQKDVCVITPISLEHTTVLGDSIGEIAAEKAGIIAPGCTTIMGQQPEEAAAIIRETCGERGATLREISGGCRVERLGCSLEGQEFILETPASRYELWLPLLGRHQLENAACAVLAAEALAERGLEVRQSDIVEGSRDVRWPARTEVLGRDPLLIVDAAHNGESARRLSETLLEDLGVPTSVFVIGASGDKDVSSIAAELAPVAAEVVATRARHPRAAPASAVAAAFKALGVKTSSVDSVADAVASALARAGAGGAVCAAGSLFVAAEARAFILGIEGDG